MSEERPPSLDPVAAARWARLPAAASPWLHEEVARRMQERLQWIRQAPQRWADWEPVRGGLQGHQRVAERYPDAECFLVDVVADRSRNAIRKIAKPWWTPSRWTSAPVHVGPPAVGGVQMVWANMLLHLTADPQALMAQWHSALAVDGFLMFSCLGPDTLRELREVYAQHGWAPPAHAFTDMHDWGDMLVQAGFAEPVMDMERITLSFETPERLLLELRELGRNLSVERPAGLRGRHWLARLHAALAQGLARTEEGGRLALTFEVIYGHAFKPAPRHPVRAESHVTLEEMRATLRQHKNNPASH